MQPVILTDNPFIKLDWLESVYHYSRILIGYGDSIVKIDAAVNARFSSLFLVADKANKHPTSR